MALSCSIIPQVRNHEGKIVDSKLFQDIMMLTNKREVQLAIYERATSSFFLTENRDILQFDDNDEPTLKSIIDNFDIDDLLGENLQSILLKNMKEDGKTYENTAENVRKLSEKASSFNTTSEYNNKFVALPILNSDGKLQMSIQKADDNTKAEAERMKANMILNERIKSILSEHGLDVGALDSLEEAIGIDGIVDFSVAKNAANGVTTLIRLSKGIKGENALPEEYAHFVIEAMRDDTFIQRSLNALYNSPELVRAILDKDYDVYAEEYNQDQLAREALGKLLTLHLLNNISTDGVSIKSLLDRTINSIKSKFSSIDAERIMDAIDDINKSMNYIANKVIRKNTRFNLDNIKVNDALKHIDRVKKTLEKIINLELKRYKIYEKRNDNVSEDVLKKREKFKENQIRLINDVKAKILNDQNNEAIVFYLESVINSISSLKSRLEATVGSSMIFEGKAIVLRNIQDYLDSYKSILNDLTKVCAEVDSSISPEVRESVKEVKQLVDELDNNNLEASIELFASALGEELTENTRNNNGNIIDKEMLMETLRESTKDVSVIGNLLYAPAQMNDIVIKLTDKMLKSRHDKARRRTQKLIDELNIVDKKLKNAGITDYDFMYQRDPEGNYSPYYVHEIDYALYDYNRRKMYDEMNQKYGTQPTGKAASMKQTEISKWYKDNFDFKTNTPKKEIYGVDVESEFDHPAKLEYYKKFKELRAELIKLIPNEVYDKHPEQVIQIRKDFLDRLKSTPKSGWGELITQQTKDLFQRREADPWKLVEYGFKDFKGREVMALPIFFVERLEDGQKDVSRDATSSLIAFANMAYEYDELSQINDILEVGRNVAERRKFSKKRFGKDLVEKFRSLGVEVNEDIYETESSTFLNAYNELLESQLYGRYAKEGTDLLDGRVNTKKVANTLNRIASLNQLALNLLAGIAAIGTDSLNLAVEAHGKRHFTRKNLHKADKIYFKELLGYLSEVGSHTKNNKLALFIREFDVLHEYESDIKNGKYNKSRLSRLLNENLLYIFMNMGSHFGEARVALALADTIKLKDSEGNEYTLWEAYDVVPNDPNDDSLGSHLKLKDGLTTIDDKPIDDKFLEAFKNKTWGINHNLFGIYNQADINNFQKTAIGCMVMMYRKHIVPAILRRFGTYQYDAMLDDQVEGYYRTSARILNKWRKDLIDIRDIRAISWNNLSDFEKSQMRQLFSDCLHIIALMVVTGLTTAFKWSDKENPYIMRMFAYQSKRIRMETMAFSPIGLPRELWQVLDSPAASINTIESMVDLLGLLYPPNYMNEIQSGRFKGHSSAYRTFMKSPLLPMNNTIYRSLHPEETIQFFNN